MQGAVIQMQTVSPSYILVVFLALVTCSSAYASDYTTDSYEQHEAIIIPEPVLGGLKLSDVTNLPEIQKRAEAGNAKAQFQLGELYKSGVEVEQNPNKAVQWFEKSADKGNVEAITELGTAYESGDGVIPDKRKAMELWQKAAERNYHPAQFLISKAFYDGMTERNLVLSCMWLRLIPKQDYDLPFEREISDLRTNLNQEMTAKQQSEAQNLARMWKNKHRH